MILVVELEDGEIKQIVAPYGTTATYVVADRDLEALADDPEFMDTEEVAYAVAACSTLKGLLSRGFKPLKVHEIKRD